MVGPKDNTPILQHSITPTAVSLGEIGDGNETQAGSRVRRL